jgi:S1-C subfamily serine protease
MSRPFTLVTLSLTTLTAFLIGFSVAGNGGNWRGAVRVEPREPTPTELELQPDSVTPADARREEPAVQPRAERQAAIAPGLVNFADVAERINPAVVNIEATTRATGLSGRRRREQPEGMPQGPSSIRPQSGSGFVITDDGEILTNYHVIQNAERIMVKFSDGRSLLAEAPIPIPILP